MPTHDIGLIVSAAKEYSTARALLAERVADFNAEVLALQRRRLPGIRTALNDSLAAQTRLTASVQEAPELFEKPQTQVLHGIRVGFRKGAGKIDWEDDAALVTAIRKHLKGDFDTLVKTTYKPIAKAISALPVDDLRKLGCTVEDTGKVVFVKAEDSTLDKLVKVILSEGRMEDSPAEG